MAAHHSHRSADARLHCAVAIPTRQSPGVGKELPNAFNSSLKNTLELHHWNRLQLGVIDHHAIPSFGNDLPMVGCELGRLRIKFALLRNSTDNQIVTGYQRRSDFA